MARFLGEPVVLVDPHGGPAGAAAGSTAAAGGSAATCVALVDVGGDVLAHGDEPGLASPLCDAVLLAAARARSSLPVRRRRVRRRLRRRADADEVLERVAEVAAAGGLLGAWGPTPEETDAAGGRRRRGADRGERHGAALRARRARARRRSAAGAARVELTPLGAVSFYFDPLVADRERRAARRCGRRARTARGRRGDPRRARSPPELAFERRVYAG